MSKKNKNKGTTHFSAPTQSNVQPQNQYKWTKWLPIFLVIISFVFLSPILKCDFLNYDDNVLIFENPIVIKGSKVSTHDIVSHQLHEAHYKPLTVLSWNLEYRIWKNNPFPYHFNNLLLHLLNALLIFYLVLMWIKKTPLAENVQHWTAFFVALLFSLHPIHIESVAWAAERKDVLYTFFFLLGMLAYTKYCVGQKVQYLILAMVLYVASFMSKSPGITLIAILPLIDIWYSRKFSIRLIVEKLPFLLLFIWALYLFGLLTNVGNHVAEVVNVGVSANGEQALNLSALSGVYKKVVALSFRFLFWLYKTIIPVQLSVLYPRKDIYESVGVAIHLMPWIIVSIGVVAYLFRKYSWLWISVLFFVVTLSPALSLSDSGEGTFLSDRYVYLPSLGIILGLVVSAFYIWGNHQDKLRYVLISMILISLIFGISSYKRSVIWQNSEVLFLDAVSKYPDKIPLAYNNLGLYYKDKKQYDKAAEYYKKTIEINPAYIKAYTNLGNIFFFIGKYKEAIPIYEKSLAMNSTTFESYSNRGACYFQLNMMDSALIDFNKALDINPKYTDALMNRGLLYLMRQDYNNALEDYNRYLKIIPHNTDILNARGLSLHYLGRYQEAINDYTFAIRITGDNGKFYLNRSYSYFALKDIANAQKDIAQAKKFGASVDIRYEEIVNSTK